MPVLNKNRTNQQIFLRAKNIQNFFSFMGKHSVCAKSHIFNPKALISIQFFGVKRSDYKTVSSVIGNASAVMWVKGFIK